MWHFISELHENLVHSAAARNFAIAATSMVIWHSVVHGSITSDNQQSYKGINSLFYIIILLQVKPPSTGERFMKSYNSYAKSSIRIGFGLSIYITKNVHLIFCASFKV